MILAVALIFATLLTWSLCYAAGEADRGKERWENENTNT